MLRLYPSLYIFLADMISKPIMQSMSHLMCRCGLRSTNALTVLRAFDLVPGINLLIVTSICFPIVPKQLMRQPHFTTQRTAFAPGRLFGVCPERNHIPSKARELVHHFHDSNRRMLSSADRKLAYVYTCAILLKNSSLFKRILGFFCGLCALNGFIYLCSFSLVLAQFGCLIRCH